MRVFGKGAWSMADESTASAVGETVTDTLSTTQDALSQSFANAFNQIIAFAPRVVAMVAVLIVGYIVARFVAGLITTLCEKIGLQTAAQRGGVADSMQKMGIRYARCRRSWARSRSGC